MLASADAFPVVGGRCTGRAHRCKAKQGRRGKTALTLGSYSHISTVLERRREGKKIYLVTMAARFCFIIAQGKECRWWPVTELLPQFSQGCSGALERDFLPARRSIRFLRFHQCRNRDVLEKGGLEQRLAASISV
jgi:hypothetical protein